MATVHERRLKDVAIPGVDRLAGGQAAAMLAQNSYVPAWPVGWLSAVLLVFAGLVEVGLAAVVAAQLIPLIVPGTYVLGDRWSYLLLVGTLAYALTLVVAAGFSSVFLGLIDMNVPSLGGGTPRFGRWRAAAWWIESDLWFARAAIVVPGWALLGVMTRSYTGLVSGLIVGGVFFYSAFRLLGSPLYALRKPARLLDDLTRRLSVRGTGDAGLAGMWSAAWTTARLISILSPLIYLTIYIVAVIVISVSHLSAAYISANLQSNFGDFLNPSGFALTAVAAWVLVWTVSLVADLIALFLLARITLSLSDSERVRRQWVLASAAGSGGRGSADRATVAVATGHPRGPAVAASPPAVPDPPLPTPTPVPEPERPVIQPSLRAFSRYRAPSGNSEVDRPVEGPPNDLDMGGGI
jgi:hypothetical protein